MAVSAGFGYTERQQACLDDSMEGDSLPRLNSMPPDDAVKQFLKCCGSQQWALQMTGDRPFSSLASIKESAERIWWSLTPDDWLEAFRSHPKIGESKAGKHTGAVAQKWSEQEQAGVSHSSGEIIDELGQLNREYESKFGFIFIVCATGKSADEMLTLLGERLGNDSEKELHTAAAEQAKITSLRLDKLLNQ
jgi:OHCU decarboxylase